MTIKHNLPRHLQPVRVSANGLFAAYPANTQGRDFVVGDIHGNFSQLQIRLERAGFDANVDRLFALGDLVDRGPESAMVREWLVKPWFISVRGNHEQMCIDASLTGEVLPAHKNHGGDWFYQLSEAVGREYANLMQKLPVAIEFQHPDIGRVGLVHGECPKADWREFVLALANAGQASDETIQTAMWSRKRAYGADMSLVTSVDRIYVGHTIMDVVTDYGNTRYIDTDRDYDGCGLALIEVGKDVARAALPAALELGVGA